MAKAKGSTLIGAVKVLRSRKSEAREVLPESLQHYLGEMISPAAWYPEEDLLGLIRAVVALTPGPADDVLRGMGVATARALGEGMYSHLIGSAASSSGTFALWASMHDSGKLTPSRESKNSLVLDLTGYACPSEEMCTLVGAYIQETLRMAGRNATVEAIDCVLTGAPKCSWRATW